uniref:PspA/IM30 family protein n=1 Tax=Minutocellus polymorphus TaxID=265543 RepID=A0A7S0FPQ4_9STRA|eukprot:CAMPEP_0197715246 /NCGR_PEP_ID=MMETSP1434-20131217/451_1 /TAXON_ID=265543 /ORGANISM="Minutocellus polymorphus, Strain CCMP3303" /LENGTH=333 /DNA_ID=CAMNT_0043299309 /DNA_START=36 /DNA_END=1037 /DNA_ORIENTATION=+
MARIVSATALASAILAASSSSSANAFVAPPPPTTSISASTFVRRQEVATVPAVAVYHPLAPRTGTTTTLQMGLVDRFLRVAKGNVNSVLQNLEAPEKIMNQAVEDMQKDLIKIRQTYAEVTASQRRVIKQKQQASAVAEDWYGRAQLALERGKEDLAREALARRQQQIEVVNELQPQIDLQAASLDKLYEGMNALEKKILEAKSKKDQYVARAKTAESVTKVNDMIGAMGVGKTSMDAFRRMEEKVEALEAAAEASAEMSGLSNLLPGGSDAFSLEKEFLMLESSASVDEELARMKKNVLGPSTSPDIKKWKAKTYDPAVEIELERVKADIAA